MIREIKKAYGGGWRAGRANKPLIRHADGTYTVEPRENPYQGRFEFFQRLAWNEGYYAGAMRSVQLWLEKIRYTNTVRFVRVVTPENTKWLRVANG